MLNQTEDTEVWDSVKTFISGHEGNVVSEHSWGTRRLAYPIQKGQQKYLEGTYHLSRFETESPFNKELENHLRLDERVLRSLILSITEEESKRIVADRIAEKHLGLGSTLDWYDDLPPEVQGVVLEMTFQMGTSGMLKFKKMIKIIFINLKIN